MTKITYYSNNSGGEWWLTDSDWKSLESAGWTVEWRDKPHCGANATSAFKHFPSKDEAIEEWERVTGKDAWESGCPCCGAPHHFEAE